MTNDEKYEYLLDTISKTEARLKELKLKAKSTRFSEDELNFIFDFCETEAAPTVYTFAKGMMSSALELENKK